MKIITYNVNGIRAAISKGFIQWLKEENPDVICLQEIKATEDQIPVLEFNEIGYNVFTFSAQKKGYSGVAVLCKKEPDKVVKGMGIKLYDDEGRFLRVDYGDLSIVSVYHPSGSSGEERQDFKMIWLDEFHNYIKKLRKERTKLVLSGDYNICHRPIDIHDPVRNATSSGFLPEEREWMSKFLDDNFIDSFRHLNSEPHQYSWWSYRANARANNKGWRIDYNMVTDNLKENIKAVKILPDAMHSDHCPVMLELNS